MRLEINIKKLSDKAVIPEYKSFGAAGFDFHAVVDQDNECFLGGKLVIPPKGQCLVKTDLAMSVPDGYELQIRPRSGLSLKHSITVTNSPGTVDADWRGNIGIILYNLGEDEFVIDTGDRIAQGVINKIEQANFNEVEGLDDTVRGDSGFGSTGVK